MVLASALVWQAVSIFWLWLLPWWRHHLYCVSFVSRWRIFPFFFAFSMADFPVVHIFSASNVRAVGEISIQKFHSCTRHNLPHAAHFRPVFDVLNAPRGKSAPSAKLCSTQTHGSMSDITVMEARPSYHTEWANQRHNWVCFLFLFWRHSVPHKLP